MKKLMVIPERCSGCRICELACAADKFHVNNPKKSAIQVMVLYPHPVIRMPIVCRQCKEPKCMENCPTDAIKVRDGIVEIDEDECISCQACVTSCPFGAIFVHRDLQLPFKCDLCEGEPKCVEACPKDAILYVPEETLGQSQRLSSVLSYAHMKEVEYREEGMDKKLRYADMSGSSASRRSQNL